MCGAAVPRARASRSSRRISRWSTTVGIPIEYRLKNANEGDVKKVWRYQSWESYSPSEQKRRTLVATLKKVAAMASSEKEMMNSAMAKLREFAGLGYPASVRKGGRVLLRRPLGPEAALRRRVCINSNQRPG